MAARVSHNFPPWFFFDFDINVLHCFTIFFPHCETRKFGPQKPKDLQRRGLIKSKEFSGHHDFGPEDVQVGSQWMDRPKWQAVSPPKRIKGPRLRVKNHRKWWINDKRMKNQWYYINDQWWWMVIKSYKTSDWGVHVWSCLQWNVKARNSFIHCWPVGGCIPFWAAVILGWQLQYGSM